MESAVSKYLFLDHGGVLDGSLTDQIPGSDDLLIFKIDEGICQVLKDGVQIVKVLHVLVSKYGYKIGFHAKGKEADQLGVLTALNDACAKKSLEFPKVSAMAVKDSKDFRGIQPDAPVIIQDRGHGIWIAGYDTELDGKACIRLALSKLLGINVTSRRYHVIFDDREKVIECAKKEGWTAFLINEKLSLLDALKQIAQKEEELVRQKEPLISVIPNRSQSQSRWQEDIIRRDTEFKNTNKPRLGGSSLSSGIFTDRNGKEWFGKSDTHDESLGEAFACKEKIAANIYSYYGVSTPQIEISRQRFTNTGLGEEEECNLYGIHVMSEILPNFKTYQQAVGNSFIGKRPNPSQHVKCVDGRTLPERGLGHILAVASLINDIDAIGLSGGNIGFQEEVDENGHLYAKTIKIDPGEALNEELSFQDHRSIRFAVPEFKKGDCQLAFADLPSGTQQEFLMTLHEIVRTPEAAFREFFSCRGAHALILYYNNSHESLTNLLLTRQKQLLREYKEDLKQTELLYKAWVEKSKMALSPEHQARNRETNAIQEQLFFYIPSDVEKHNQRVPLSVAIQSILRDEEESIRVLFVKGPPGTGKSLNLLHLEQLLLKKRRENSKEPMPIYVDLKRFNTQTVQQSFIFVLKEKYHLNPEDIRQDKIILLMDGYDEIAGGCEKNLYQCQRLDQWPKLKMIISCRTRYLRLGYRDWFTPSSSGEGFEEYELLPFTQEQIDKYIKQYVQAGQRDYNLQEYQHHIKNIPNLASLITNPFILRVLVESLPELIKHVQNGEVNRYSVYESLMRAWFIKQERRLSQGSGVSDNWDAIKAFEDFFKMQ